jgi:hypothetical protein
MTRICDLIEQLKAYPTDTRVMVYGDGALQDVQLGVQLTQIPLEGPNMNHPNAVGDQKPMVRVVIIS